MPIYHRNYGLPLLHRYFVEYLGLIFGHVINGLLFSQMTQNEIRSINQTIFFKRTPNIHISFCYYSNIFTIKLLDGVYRTWRNYNSIIESKYWLVVFCLAILADRQYFKFLIFILKHLKKSVVHVIIYTSHYEFVWYSLKNTSNLQRFRRIYEFPSYTKFHVLLVSIVDNSY